MSENMKAAIVFAIGLSPNPISRFERLVSQKLSSGVFAPAVTIKLNGGPSSDSSIPLLCLDALNEAAFEEMRALLHKRIDATFDTYKKNWQERAGEKVNTDEPSQEQKELNPVKVISESRQE
jgi:hypothetical protein